MAVEDQAGERREWTVSGMDCGSCAIKVRGAVERLPGVSQVNIATMTERLSLTLDPIQTSAPSWFIRYRGQSLRRAGP